MAFVARCFWHAKDLDHTRDYEDAFEVAPQSGRAAIADGVSSAMFSRRWAQILTAAAVETPPHWDEPESVSSWIAERRRAWSKAIDANSLPWMQRMKLQESGGGYAAFLWLEMTPAEEDSWQYRAIASGDCCLFHVRDGQLLDRFPLTCEADFDRDPVTWGSSARHRDRVLPFQSQRGTCRDGDWLVLSSDALAKWLYRLSDGGLEIPWNALWEQTAAEWTQRVATLRDLPTDERIRVDDTTLVMLAIGASTSATNPSVSVTAATRDAALLSADEEVVMAELVDDAASEEVSLFPTAQSPQTPARTEAVPERRSDAAISSRSTADAEAPSKESKTESAAEVELNPADERPADEAELPEAELPETTTPDTPLTETPLTETQLPETLQLDADRTVPLESLALDASAVASEPLPLPSLSPLDTEPKPSGPSSSSTSEEG